MNNTDEIVKKNNWQIEYNGFSIENCSETKKLEDLVYKFIDNGFVMMPSSRQVGVKPSFDEDSNEFKPQKSEFWQFCENYPGMPLSKILEAWRSDYCKKNKPLIEISPILLIKNFNKNDHATVIYNIRFNETTREYSEKIKIIGKNPEINQYLL